MRLHLLIVLLALALLSGCAGTQHTASTSSTLDVVNEQLQGERATIVLSDSQRFGPVDEVRVQSDTTVYHTGRLDYRKTVATEKIDRIFIRKDSGASWWGFLIGATPGLVVTAPGLGAIGNDDAGYSVFALILGPLIAFGGGVVGGIIGSMINQGEAVVVYRGPVSRYQTNRPD